VGGGVVGGGGGGGGGGGAKGEEVGSKNLSILGEVCGREPGNWEMLL